MENIIVDMPRRIHSDRYVQVTISELLEQINNRRNNACQR